MDLPIVRDDRRLPPLRVRVEGMKIAPIVDPHARRPCPKPMQVDLRKISGKKKHVWLMNPADGSVRYLGEYDNKICEFSFDGAYLRGSDRVLIAVDQDKNYIPKNATQLEEKW